MATEIDTSTFADATGASAAPLVAFAPSDDSAIVLYHDGTAPQLATAQSPYTTWTVQSIGGSTLRHMNALHVNSDDSVDVMVCSPSNDAWYFHYARSANSWSSDGNHNVTLGAGNSSGTVQTGWMGKDAQGRLWWVVADQTLATRTLYAAYASSPTSSWTTSLSVTISNVYPGLPFASIIGNYLVVVYQDDSNDFLYQRLDVSGATLGSWSTAATITAGDVGTDVQGCLVDDGNGTGVMVHSGTSGITGYTYTPTTDTWSAGTSLSSSSSDLQPTLVSDGSGTVYAVWSQFSASNSYALVFKTYSGSWSSSARTIAASGSNLHFFNGVYVSSGTKLAYIYTSGTTSPYSVEWDTFTISSTITGSATFTHSFNLSLGQAQTLGRATFSTDHSLVLGQAQALGNVTFTHRFVLLLVPESGGTLSLQPSSFGTLSGAPSGFQVLSCQT